MFTIRIAFQDKTNVVLVTKFASRTTAEVHGRLYLGKISPLHGEVVDFWVEEGP